MKKILYFLLLITIGLTACKKEKTEAQDNLSDHTNQPNFPAGAKTTMMRTIDFLIRRTSVDTVYTYADKIITEAGYGYKAMADKEKNTFYISFNAGPHLDNTAGDYIHFAIDKAKLKADFVGVYSTEAQTAIPLYDIHYSYSVKKDGGIRGNILNWRMGLQMTGNLKIDTYDAVKQTISGSYRMASNLNSDPSDFSIGIDPDDLCKLTVSGTFSNVKVKQE